MAKALLILGAAVRPGGQPSPALERRARHGAELFLKGGYDLILASGGKGDHPPSEAELIANICRQQGVPAEKILLEDRSTTTRENIAFSLPLLSKAGVTEITLVTDYYHLPRALMTAHRQGLRARGSFPRQGLSKTPIHRHLYLILREVLALPVYWLRGQR